MDTVLVSLIQTTFKFICFIVIAYGGIICGKKFRDSKDAKKGVENK